MAVKKVTRKKDLLPKEVKVENNFLSEASQNVNKPFFTKKNVVLLAILFIAVLGWKFKGQFIAATVNGQPISRMELNSQLEKKFGSQVLDNLVNERLIMGGARQKGIFVTSDEIDKKVSEIEERLKGKITLDDALKAQGLTKEDFKRQIEIQVSIDKLFAKESTVSSKEIDDYISKNSQAFKSATDPAQVKNQVNDILKQQKVSEAFDVWFEDIKKNAKVNKFI
jgi:hypothetical protein